MANLLQKQLPVAEVLATDGHTYVQFVLARDLHQWLSIGRDFSTWFKERLTKYGYEKKQDYVVASECPGYAQFFERMRSLGRPEINYYITVDMAKELALIENSEKGRLARRYLILCTNTFIKNRADTAKEEARLQHQRALFEYSRAESATQIARLARKEVDELVEQRAGLYVMAERAWAGIDDRGFVATKDGVKLKQTKHEIDIHNECQKLMTLGREYGQIGQGVGDNRVH